MKASEFRKHFVEQIIPFWNAMRDDENGGFYGAMDATGRIDQYSDKGIILNNRIMWFYSNAYMLLQEEALLDNARHAWEFLKKYGYDKLRGGIYWSVSYDGIPLDDIKHTYNQAFSIYALSSFYEASGEKEALAMAYEQYELVERICRDADGYLESFDWNFSKTSNEKLSENGVVAERTMNTLLHILEAYTELYRVDHNEKVGETIREILNRFLEKIYDSQKGICNVFFDMKYHSLIDLESYGHDIETSWLIDRACSVLGDDAVTKRMSDMTIQMAKTVYDNAYDTVNFGIYNERENEKIDHQKIWWVQAEAVIGFYNLYQKNGNELFLKASKDTWKYIQDNLIDPKLGEWYESRMEDGSIDLHRGYVHEWKCPYHNGRMCMEMIKRMEQ